MEPGQLRTFVAVAGRCHGVARSAMLQLLGGPSRTPVRQRASQP